MSFPPSWAISQLEGTFPVKDRVIPGQCLMGEGEKPDELYKTVRCTTGLLCSGAATCLLSGDVTDLLCHPL